MTAVELRRQFNLRPMSEGIDLTSTLPTLAEREIFNEALK
jgi:hypothetical protein